MLDWTIAVNGFPRRCLFAQRRFPFASVMLHWAWVLRNLSLGCLASASCRGYNQRNSGDSSCVSVHIKGHKPVMHVLDESIFGRALRSSRSLQVRHVSYFKKRFLWQLGRTLPFCDQIQQGSWTTRSINSVAEEHLKRIVYGFQDVGTRKSSQGCAETTRERGT